MFSSEDHEEFHGRARFAPLDARLWSALQNAALLAVLLVCVIGVVFFFRTISVSLPEGYDPTPMALLGP